MRNKRLLPTLPAVWFVLFASIVSAALPAVPAHAVSVSASTWEQLSAAIASQDVDTIELAGDIARGTSAETLRTDSRGGASLTIDGQGFTINGQYAKTTGEAVLRIAGVGDPKKVVLKNLTITGGYKGVTGGGGGVYVQNSNVEMTDVTIRGNKASIGGGIYVDGGMTWLIRTTVSDNEAVNGGGGVYIQNAKVWIEDSLVARNGLTNTAGPEGGGIYITKEPLNKSRFSFQQRGVSAKGSFIALPKWEFPVLLPKSR